MMSEDPIAFLSNVSLQCEIVTYHWCFLQQKKWLHREQFTAISTTMCNNAYSCFFFFSFLEINVFGNKGFGSGEVILLFNH